MSVKFEVVAKSNPQNRDEEKFYVQPIRKETITCTKREEAITRETSLSKTDTRRVLVTLSDILGDSFTKGIMLKG